MNEGEFKNNLLGGTTLFITLTLGLSALRTGIAGGNFMLGALGASVCAAGIGISYKIFQKALENAK